MPVLVNDELIKSTMLGFITSNATFYCTLILIAIYVYFKFIVFDYFAKKGVPYETPVVPFGNGFPLMAKQMCLGTFFKKFYNKFKKHRFFGLYVLYKRIVVINDPELIRLIMVKEFSKFPERGFYHNSEVDKLSDNLFLEPAKIWKPIRSKLTPTFTSGKLKQMFPYLQEIGDELLKICNKVCEESDNIDLKDITERYTTDSSCSIAYGYNCDSLNDSENKFKINVKRALMFGSVRSALAMFTPKIMEKFGIPLFNRSSTDFFMKRFDEVVAYRRNNNVVRNDFLNTLIKLIDHGVIEDDANFQDDNDSDTHVERISQSSAAAHAFVFFLGGYETTSSAISYCLYELAMHPEVQTRLRDEIDEFSQKPGGITYDAIANGLEYLHMVFLETLRKHPTFAYLIRECAEDYAVPDSNFTIEKGVRVMVPVSGLHHDPDIYPEPEKFDPLRFTKENIAKRSPYVYLPFGTGPRMCVAYRFGTLQAKVALVSLLSNFEFSVCDKTMIPLTYSKRTVVQTPEKSVYLRIKKRNDGEKIVG